MIVQIFGHGDVQHWDTCSCKTLRASRYYFVRNPHFFSDFEPFWPIFEVLSRLLENVLNDRSVFCSNMIPGPQKAYIQSLGSIRFF